MRKVLRFSRNFLTILLFVIYFTALSLFVGNVQAETLTLTRVYGKVFDSKSQPIPDSHVIFALPAYRRGQKPTVIEVKTDASGSYEAWVTENRNYDVYAYCDLNSTAGFDYVPAYQRISLEKASLNVSFTLLPGALVQTMGNFTIFGSEPVQTIFTVIDQSGLLNKTNSLTEYTPLVNDLLSMDHRIIVVPSDTPVKVRVDMIYQMLELHLTIDKEGDYLNLSQNAKFIDNLRSLIVEGAVNYTSERLQSVQVLVDEAERAGFYVSYEKVRLNSTENLLEAAQSSLVEKDYDMAHADSYEAYLIIRDLETSFQSMYVNTSESVFFITPFLGVTAVVLAYVLSESQQRRLTLSLCIYGVLIGLLYLFYPGYDTLQRWIYSLWAVPLLSVLIPIVLVVVSFITAYFVILKIPQAREGPSIASSSFLGAMVAAFSLAARNLMRRRFRTLLTSTLMLISVFAFITLTSFSYEYGFNVQPQSGSPPSQGFLLRKPLVNNALPFEPVEIDVLHWLEENSEAALVAPMIQNTPKIGINSPPLSITSIYAPNSGLNFNISGMMGVFPDLEAKVTKIESIVINGRFLSDKDVNGILISEKVAQELQVEPNDTLKLYGETFYVTGIFDSGKFDSLKDLDGQSLSPRYVIQYISPPIPPENNTYYVPGQEVVIMHGKAALNLTGMVVSRIDVQTRSHQEIMDLARLAVLTWPKVEAFTATSGDINRLFIGSYYVLSGFNFAFVPLVLIVLNVGITMLGAVYERKREVATMSYVGLNPFHVTAVFVAEALVMGIVAGSLGYILGLMSYHFMSLLGLSLVVKQKVEAVWGILALCFSITAGVIGSALPAYRASIITAPSMLRKFVITSEEKPKTSTEPWRLNMPIRIRREDLQDFFNFIDERLQRYTTYSAEKIDNLKLLREKADDPLSFNISFTYIFTEDNTITNNRLYPIEDSIPNQYSIQLASKTRLGTLTARDEADVHRTAKFIRNFIFQYDYEHKT